MIRPLFCLLLTCSIVAPPAMAQDSPVNLDKSAVKMFEQVFSTQCDWAYGGNKSPAQQMEKFELHYVPSYDPQSPVKTVVLYRFFCGQGAYNEQHAYLLQREYEGLQPLHFSVPTFRADFQNDDSENGKLISLALTGFDTQTILVNSVLDAEAGTITAHSYWRGMGDASSDGTWVFEDGGFVLKHYAVDPSYNGKEDPVTLVDYLATN